MANKEQTSMCYKLICFDLLTFTLAACVLLNSSLLLSEKLCFVSISLLFLLLCFSPALCTFYVEILQQLPLLFTCVSFV